MTDIREITGTTRRYNLHSHTQFCDGHAPMQEFVVAARESGIRHYGFSPHSPFPFHTPCNMAAEAVPYYLAEVDRLRAEAGDALTLYASMEIDYVSDDFGPHTDYFRRLPLDYRIGSVHFVPTQDGRMVDCDGSPERFARYLQTEFRSDLRYVVEKYYEQVLRMLEHGGFGILAHFDKIGLNASYVDPDIEHYGWYAALVDDVISRAVDSGTAIEINTKHFGKYRRFFPHQDMWLPRVVAAGASVVVNSDAHWPDKIAAGREDAFEVLKGLDITLPDE